MAALPGSQTEKNLLQIVPDMRTAFPIAKHEAFLENDGTYKASWLHKRRDLADKSLVAQMAADDETARAGFVSKAQLDIFRSEFLDQFVDGVQRAADNAVTADLGGVLGRDGNGDGFFVDVQADVMDDFVHGCLVSLLCYQ